MTDPDVRSPADELETIVLLSADSLRADRVHTSRNGEPLTPRIDELAEDALKFRPGVAPGPSTRDTMPSLVTGAYASEFDEYGLPDAETSPRTIAEELSDRGFATAAFSHNNFTSRRYNFDRGFDHFDDVSAEARKETDRGAWRLYVRNLIDETPLLDAAVKANTLVMEHLGRSLFLRNESGERLTDRAIEWLEETDGKRFLWIHYMDTHHPYLSPPRIQERYGRVFSETRIKQLTQKIRNSPEKITNSDVPDVEYVYDCSVRYVDEQIGRIVDHLRAEGAFEDAFIALTGDHGEGLGEFDKFGHADEMWDTLLTVPLIVRHPDCSSRTVDGQAPLRLLYDTIVDGEGLLDVADAGVEYVYTEVPAYRDDLRAVRGNEFKLIDDGDERIATRVDGEAESVVPLSELPDAEYDRLESELEREFETTTVGSDVRDREYREDLAALGYLDE